MIQDAKLKVEPSLNIAIAGLGFGEAVHIPALKACQNLIPYALFHPNQAQLDQACKSHQIKGYSDWSLLLRDKNINGIIIATPPAPRYELAYKALEAGKHLLLEKPVALTSTEIEKLQRLALQKNLCVAVDFEYRAVPLFMQAKRLLEEKSIGTIWLVKFDWLMGSRADKSRAWDWYSEAKKGGGVLGALGTHAFDILHWLIGPISHLQGQVSTSIKERVDPISESIKPVSSEDVCLAQLKIKENLTQYEIPAQLSLSAVAQSGRGCWIEIYGSKGTMILGSDNQKDYVHGFSLWVGKKGEQLKSITPDSDLGYTKTWNDGRIAPVKRLQEWWHQSIILNRPVLPGLLEGLESQIACEKVIESSETGLRVSIRSTQ